MKGHKAHHHSKHAVHHHHYEKGGKVGEGLKGVPEYEMDIKEVPHARISDKPTEEAKKLKAGGRAKRKHGGHVMHHHSGHVKHVGAVHGAAAHHHAGRKPRKAGGKVGSDASPLSSAHRGKNPPGHMDMDID